MASKEKITKLKHKAKEIFKQDKKFMALRFSIYFCGLFLIFFLIFLEVAKPESRFFSFSESSHPYQLLFLTPLEENFNQVEVTLYPKNEGFRTEELDVRVAKIPLPMTRMKKKLLLEENDLKKILFKKNDSIFPNGSLLQYGATVYFLEKGKLKPFASKNQIRKLGFDLKKIKKINNETFVKFEISQETPFLVKKREYPEGLIFKSGNEYFVTGAQNLYPIFSEKLITKIWEDFSFIETADLKMEKMARMSCFFNQENNSVFCEKNLNQIGIKNGDTCMITVAGIAKEDISSAEIKITKKIGLGNFLNSTKKLLFQK